MPHFRLRKVDDLHNQEALECDQPTVEGALANFGHQLKVMLALDGDVFRYILESRTHDGSNFKDSDQIPVFVVSDASN